MSYERKRLNYFMTHESQARLIPELTDQQAGALYKNLCLHFTGSSGETVKMDGITNAIYSMMVEQMDRERAAYEEVCKVRQQASLKAPQCRRKNARDNQMTPNGYQVDTKWLPNVDKEKEKEKENEKENEKEKEKEKEIGQETSSCPNSSSNITDSVAKNLFSLSDGFTKRVVELWNTLNLQQIRSIVVGSIRHQNLVARVKEFGEEAVFEAINNVAMSEFLRGNNREGWQATFEWMVKPNNFVKVLEGNYANRVTRVTDTPDRIAIVDTFK